MNARQDDFSLNDILNVLRAYWRFLLKKWWLLILVGLIGATLGTVYYYKQSSKYEAVTTFLLEDKSSGGGGLAGLVGGAARERIHKELSLERFLTGTREQYEAAIAELTRL